ncbi:hypothetical protein [Nonomuraea sp. NPDC046570]|uniref:hypothetical protein n=1 Tax=Nonomuraea sp. NPDC046570 TaxID=3155255 RepID=UPI0033DF30FC
MKAITKLATVVAGSALALGTLAMAPAGAATANTAAGAGCAQVEHWKGRISQTVRVTNRCGYTISFRVRRTGPDSRCYLLANNRAQSYQWGRGLNFQGINWNCA